MEDEMKKRARSVKMLRTGFAVKMLRTGFAATNGTPGIAKAADDGWATFHLSKDRPLVVFDPDGPFDCISVTDSGKHTYVMGRKTMGNPSGWCHVGCSVCEETTAICWMNWKPLWFDPEHDAPDLFECLGCGTVFNPADDI